MYYQLHNTTSTILRTKSKDVNVFRLVLQLSMRNPSKPDVKSRMKMQLEQRRQVMFQWHLCDQQLYRYLGAAYIRSLEVRIHPQFDRKFT